MENTSNAHENGNFANRDGILLKGDIIISNKTAKQLICYTDPAKVYIGKNVVRVEYYLWDDVKKKSKRYKDSEIKLMLNGSWRIQPCR